MSIVCRQIWTDLTSAPARLFILAPNCGSERSRTDEIHPLYSIVRVVRRHVQTLFSYENHCFLYNFYCHCIVSDLSAFCGRGAFSFEKLPRTHLSERGIVCEFFEPFLLFSALWVHQVLLILLVGNCFKSINFDCKWFFNFCSLCIGRCNFLVRKLQAPRRTLFCYKCLSLFSSCPDVCNCFKSIDFDWWFIFPWFN